jgi:hypothetical protein
MRRRPDWTGNLRRYIVHFNDGSAGMRNSKELHAMGQVIESREYRVVRVLQP